MKKLLCGILSLWVLLMLFGCGKPEASTQTGEPILSSFSAMDVEGTACNQDILADAKVTMINIWGTFCAPCISEMPDLALLDDAFGDNFQVVGIIIDAADRNGNTIPEKKAEALSIIGQTGADYRHLLPSPSLTAAYLSRVEAVPETIFVNAEGKQIGERYLGAKSYDDWHAIIEALLDE